MSVNYPIFTLNNESVIIRPGKEFSKNELNSRLQQMGLQINEMKDKATMAGIYDSYLQHNQNRLKIFNLLRKDTQMRNSRLGLTQRESVPPSNTMSNTSKNKLINMSNDVRPFEQGNRRVQEINTSQKIYTNKPEFTPNTFVSNNMNQDQDKETVDYRYPNNFNQKTVQQSFNNSRNFQNNNINATHRSEFNNYQNLDNSKINYNNTSNNSNYPSFNNENSIRVRETNNSINEKSFTNKGTPSYNQYQEFNSSNLRNSNSNQLRNNNNNNYNNNYDNYNSKNNYSGNMNPNIQRMNIEPNHQSQVLYRQEISTGINNNINQRREPDVESEFSIFSTFRKLKNTPLFKNKKHICVNIVLSLLIICLVIGFLNLINTYWDSITEYFSELGNRGFVDAVFGFFSSVFFGTFRYITIPLVILIFLIVLGLKNYLFNKRCEEIFNNIVNDLRNGTTRSGNRYLSYEDMYRDYAKKYGISKEEFQKKYIKKLENMRRNKNGMKKFNQKDNNGNDIIFWEYDN